ncbi:hypothetical protein ACSNOI_06220 [Actinomadura kijaniata]|uniref:hypothetical protein n=1 Tax=Actinomadura kijaniata TaxID=46161 RepID=UPI003F1A9E81
MHQSFMRPALRFLFQDWNPAAVFTRAVLQMTGTVALLILGSWMSADLSPAGFLACPVLLAVTVFGFGGLLRVGTPAPVLALGGVVLAGQAALIVFSTVALNQEFEHRALLQRGITTECVVNDEPVRKNRHWRHKLHCTDGNIVDYRTKTSYGPPLPKGHRLQMRIDPRGVTEPVPVEKFQAVSTRGLARVFSTMGGTAVVLTGLLGALGLVVARTRRDPRARVERLRAKFPVWEISEDDGLWSATIPTGASVTATSLDELERLLTERSFPHRR